MTANDSKPCLSYWHKLVDQYNNTYHHSINKKPVDADYSVLTETIEAILNLPILKLLIESELKVLLRIGQEKCC